MRLSVLLLPARIDSDLLVVVDALRFTSAAATALHHGANAILPVPTIEAARALKATQPESLLCGERGGLKPPGFALGNSPLEFTREAVQGRTLIWTTTNGTRAIERALGVMRPTTPGAASNPPTEPRPARSEFHPELGDFLLLSPVNLSAVVASLEQCLRDGASVAVVCAGSDGGFSLEDAHCAGRLVTLLRQRLGDELTLNDGARACASIDEAYGEDFARCFRDARHGRTLGRLGFADDLQACGALDAHPVLPRGHGGRIIAG